MLRVGCDRKGIRRKTLGSLAVIWVAAASQLSGHTVRDKSRRVPATMSHQKSRNVDVSLVLAHLGAPGKMAIKLLLFKLYLSSSFNHYQGTGQRLAHMYRKRNRKELTLLFWHNKMWNILLYVFTVILSLFATVLLTSVILLRRYKNGRFLIVVI